MRRASAAGAAGRRTATERFGPGKREIMRLEDFVRSLPFLEGPRRDKVLIVATEILDNILSHSSGLKGSRATVRIGVSRATGEASAVFWFKSDNFASFAEREPEAGRVHFDARDGRYRGLGLTMCRRLAASMRFRRGSLADSIIIRI